MKKSTKICLIIFFCLFVLFAVGGTLIDLFPPSEERPETLEKFEALIGTENYNELTSEYTIKFIENAEDDGAIYPKLKQIRIKCATERRMLIALCHEYGHYVALRDDLANDEKYIRLFHGDEPIWYGNYDMTKTAYSDINEFCASYVGMGFYNKIDLRRGGAKCG